MKKTAQTNPLDPDLAVIARRWRESMIPPDARNKRDVVAAAMAQARALRPDNTWADVDYAGTQRSDWGPSYHADRFNLMARAYACLPPGKERETLRAAALHALEWWAAHDPQCPNWWWNQIGTGQLCCETLLCLGETVPANLLTYVTGTVLPRSDRTATGANQVWFAENVIGLGVLANRPEMVDKAFRRLYTEIKIAPAGATGAAGEGVQPDRSLHQHGQQFYSGGYGLAFGVDCARFTSFAWGTHFQIPPDRMALLVGYLLDGQQWMIRGDTFDYSALGREITRKGKVAVPRSWLRTSIVPTGVSAGMGQATALLSKLSVPRRAEFDAFAARLAAGYTPHPQREVIGNRHFWNSDYMSHRREGYFASVRMYSVRTQNTEMVNDEGRLSHHIADGTLFLYKTGTEYQDIFPLWDWRKIPGTTAEQGLPSLKDIGALGRHGKTDFVGGVSDGVAGMAVFDFVRDTLKIRKSWAFFGDQIVCLGAGLSCESERPVATTINQCWADTQGGVAKGKAGNGASWWLHGGVGYLFPAGAPLPTGGIEKRTGRWSDFGTGSKTPVTGEVFTLTLDHGLKPSEKNASYAYVLLPNTDVKALALRAAQPPAKDPIVIIENSPRIQAVWHRGEDRILAAFYEPGAIATEGDNNHSWGIGVDQPCAISIQTITTGGKRLLRVAVANPRNQPLKVSLRVNRRVSGPGALPAEEAAGSVLYLDLPAGELVGKSLAREFPIVG